LTQFVSPDDEHDVLETCRVKNKNKYTERNLCVTLVIYQESLHNAWSTKCKTKFLYKYRQLSMPMHICIKFSSCAYTCIYTNSGECSVSEKITCYNEPTFLGVNAAGA